jgi:hypothetical protein
MAYPDGDIQGVVVQFLRIASATAAKWTREQIVRIRPARLQSGVDWRSSVLAYVANQVGLSVQEKMTAR